MTVLKITSSLLLLVSSLLIHSQPLTKEKLLEQYLEAIGCEERLQVQSMKVTGVKISTRRGKQSTTYFAYAYLAETNSYLYQSFSPERQRVNAYDGKNDMSWTISRKGELSTQKGIENVSGIKNFVFGKWCAEKEEFPEIQYEGLDPSSGYYVLDSKPGSSKYLTRRFIDPTSFQIIRDEVILSEDLSFISVYSDFQTNQGISFPFITESSSGENSKTVVNLISVEIDVDIPTDFFQNPKMPIGDYIAEQIQQFPEIDPSDIKHILSEEKMAELNTKTIVDQRKSPSDQVFEAIEKANMYRLRLALERDPMTVHTKNLNGQTPLIYMTKMMINRNFLFITENKETESYKKDLQMVQILLDHGAKKDAVDPYGKTALDHAKESTVKVQYGKKKSQFYAFPELISLLK